MDGWAGHLHQLRDAQFIVERLRKASVHVFCSIVGDILTWPLHCKMMLQVSEHLQA